jgi:fructoselysine-6-phosphate deglycase
MHFNQEEFLSNYEQVTVQFTEVAQIAKRLKEKSVRQIFFVGCGGAYTKFVNLRPTLFKKLTVPFLIVSPEELSALYLDEMDEQTLIIAGTKTGETAELILALENVKQQCPQTTILGFVGDQQTTLDQKALLDERISSVDTDVHLILLGWFILHYTNELSEAEQNAWASQLQQAGKKIAAGITAVEAPALEMVNKINIDKMQMWVTSGRLWGEICCFSNYILEEIQWIQAQSIHASEFFHGPFELVSDEFQVNVVINSGATRAQDLRVADFVKKHTQNYFLLDMNDFGLSDLPAELLEFIEPYALNHYFDTLLHMYTERTGKSSKTRRYYRVTEY